MHLLYISCVSLILQVERMTIKILELGTLTELTEEEEESYKGGIGETVSGVTEALKTTANNTTNTTIPASISGVKQVLALTTEPTKSILPTPLPKLLETT